MKKILFFGLGHLGRHFVKFNKVHSITGTKRKLEGHKDFTEVRYSLGEAWNIQDEFDVIIISFPPVENYPSLLADLLKKVKNYQQLVFISSTSVFGDGDIKESSQKNGDGRNSKKLIECERIIKEQKNHIIIRPSGLIDEDRHPSRFFRNNKKLSKSQTNVNLVHTADVARFLHHIIDKNITNEEFNLVCDSHPTKEVFYGKFHDDLVFDRTQSKTRIIDNTKSKQTGFTYHYSDLEWSYHGQVHR